MRRERHCAVGPVVLLVGWVLLVGSVESVPAAAQTAGRDDEDGLAERYRKARLETLARRYLQREGGLPVYSPEHLPTPTDTLASTGSSRSAATADEPSFVLRDVRSVRRLEQGWFQQRFADTEWAFLGETRRHTFLDTTRTVDLRARLQAQFGDPTRTLADSPLEKPPGERPQFEYWFVVNDSIPVQVMDAEGPTGRGLILTVERRYRDQLPALRDALLAPLRDSEPAPYLDYYYDDRRERWYRTGFDGQAFVHEQISGTAVVPGQRARLDTVQTSESSPSSGDSSP